MLELDDLTVAIGVVLILEGLLPLLAPGLWKQLAGFVLADVSNGGLRVAGLITVPTGLAIVFLAGS